MEALPPGARRERTIRGMEMRAPFSEPLASPRSTRLRDGVTLVEVLVAIGLSALVLSLLFTVLEATRRVLLRHHTEFRAGSVSPESGVRLLIRDLVSATDPENGRPPMAMERDHNAWRLRWTSVYLLPGPEPAPGLLPLELRYQDGAVYRAEDGHMPDTAWMDGIARMEIAFYDGREWHSTWPPDDRSPALPAAVRLEVQPEGGQPLTVEVSLPAADRLDD